MKLLSFFFTFCVLFFLLPNTILGKSKREKQLISLNARLNDFVASKEYAQALSFCNSQINPSNDEAINRFLIVSKLRLFVKSRTSLDSVPFYFDEQKKLDIGKDSIDLFLTARAQEIYAHHFYLKKNTPKAIQNLQLTDSLYQFTDAYEYRIYNLNMLGTIYQLNNNLTDALITLTRADRLLMDYLPNDSILHIDLHIDIGLIFFKLRRYNKAIGYYTDLLAYRLNEEQKAQIFNNLAIINIEKQEYKLALSYLIRAEEVYKKLGYTQDLARVYNNMGSAFESIDSTANDTIIYYYTKSATIKIDESDTAGIIAPLLNLSSFYIKNYNDNKAIPIINQLKSYFSFFSFQDFSSYYLIKSIVADRNADYKNSLSYYKLYHAYSDSVQKDEQKWQSTKAEQEIELEKKQSKIAILEKEQTLAESKTEQQRLIIIIISIASIISIITLILFVNYYYKRQRLEKKLRNKEVALASVSNLVRGQEEERLRIAKDLHDGVGNNLAMIKAEILKNKSYENHKYLAKMVSQTSEEVRTITHDLMPVAIRKFGLKEALTDLVEKWKHTSQVYIDINYEGELSIDKNSSLTIYRIVQELIKNAITHGEAKYINLLIFQADKNLHLNYEDTGNGFELEKLEKGVGIGFQNIVNRVSYLNGKMDIQGTSTGLKISFVFLNIINESSSS